MLLNELCVVPPLLRVAYFEEVQATKARFGPSHNGESPFAS